MQMRPLNATLTRDRTWILNDDDNEEERVQLASDAKWVAIKGRRRKAWARYTCARRECSRSPSVVHVHSSLRTAVAAPRHTRARRASAAKSTRHSCFSCSASAMGVYTSSACIQEEEEAFIFQVFCFKKKRSRGRNGRKVKVHIHAITVTLEAAIGGRVDKRPMLSSQVGDESQTAQCAVGIGKGPSQNVTPRRSSMSAVPNQNKASLGARERHSYEIFHQR